MANEELDALIVRNMKQARLAYERLEYSISEVAQRQLERAFASVRKRLDWRGNDDWDEDELWAAPPEWDVAGADGEESGYLGRVSFCQDGADGEGAAADHLWLVTLCQEGRGRFGLKLDRADGLGMTPGRWKKFVNGRPAAQRLVSLGYLHDDRGHFFRPVDFTSEALASAIEVDDFEEFLRPLTEAMAALPEAASAFGEILADARAVAGA